MEVVDLHLHSTASDGVAHPRDVVAAAVKAGLAAIALTDHDTVAGVAEARREASVRVIAGCEFSVGVWWGELHLLGYFLPTDDESLTQLFDAQRTHRAERADEILARLRTLGISLSMESVRQQAGDAPIGRPHIARALVDVEEVGSLDEAFVRYLADGAPAFVPKPLPAVETVVALVSRLGGVTSAAHLRQRGTRKTVRKLRDAGVDAVEVLHPAHDEGMASALLASATDLGMLATGGSDWHGSSGGKYRRRGIGEPSVPAEWLVAMERLHLQRIGA